MTTQKKRQTSNDDAAGAELTPLGAVPEKYDGREAAQVMKEAEKKIEQRAAKRRDCACCGCR